MNKWTVICRPASKTEEEEKEGELTEIKNVGGLAVLLTDAYNTSETEVALVGFVRRNTANPMKSFRRALKEAIDAALASAEELNRSEEENERVKEEAAAAGREAERRREEAYMKHQAALREIRAREHAGTV